MSEQTDFGTHSETRPMRPYAGVDAVQNIFESLYVCIGDSPIFPGGTAIVDGGDFINSSVWISGRVDKSLEEIQEGDRKKANEKLSDALKKSLYETQVPIEDIEILIIATTPYLHLSETVWQGSILAFTDSILTEDGLELVANGGSRPGPLQAPQGGCDISIFVSLSKAQPQRIGIAWRKGTWLASITMRIRTEHGNFGFTPEPLSDAIREQFGLPPNTIRYIDLPSTVEPADGASHISAFIDEDILIEITNNPRSDSSIVFQRQLVLDVMTAVIYKASKELVESDFNSYSQIETSLCGQLIASSSRNEKNQVDEEKATQFFHLLKQEPAQFVSYQEARISPKTTLLRTLVRSE